MFLKRLSLKNIRSIKQLDLSFDAPSIALKNGNKRKSKTFSQTRKWTLILGENGTGKSSVLRSIALITAGSAALTELLADPNAWIRTGENECRIEADLITAEGEERNISLHWLRGQNIKEIFEFNKPTLDQLDRALEHADRNYFTIGYGASRRLASTRFSTQSIELFNQTRARNVATLFSFDAVLNSLENWAMDLHYRVGRGSLQIVRSAMNDLLPDVSFSSIDKENRTLLFETVDGLLPLNQLSDGYQSMAGWCGDLLFRITETYKDYKEPLKARGLLLIDELDLHLHPIWQRSLRQFLDVKMPNFQIIATTHSPLTAHEAGEDELYFLRRAGEEKSSVLNQYVGAPNKLFAHQLLMSPAFGLASINSKEIEDKRQEYRQLKRKETLTTQEKRRFKNLSEEISEVPEWRRETPLEEKQLAVLEKIETVLGSGNIRSKRKTRK
jgi:predicted ATP-binding protein involved in virulence